MSFARKLKIWLLVRPPGWLRRLFRRSVWRIEEAGESIFLTFDDGPIPELTPWILDQLDHYQAKATFFCVGDNVRKHPDLFAELIHRGHAVGNHSFSHLNGLKSGSRRYIRDVYKAHRLINSRLFRPPYGRSRWLARQWLLRRFRFVLWDVLSLDYDQTLSADEVVNNVLQHAREGSIVVFHDNLKAQPRLTTALPAVLKHYSELNWRFEKLDKLL